MGWGGVGWGGVGWGGRGMSEERVGWGNAEHIEGGNKRGEPGLGDVD